jgi:hypothetical protein
LRLWPGQIPIQFFLLDRDSGRRSEILPHEKAGRYRPMSSQDGRWLTFNVEGLRPEDGAQRSVLVTPFQEGAVMPQKDWISIAGPLPGLD